MEWNQARNIAVTVAAWTFAVNVIVADVFVVMLFYSGK